MVIENPSAVRPKAKYIELAALLNDERSLASIRRWMMERNISAFNPFEHAPMNDAKRDVVRACTTGEEMAVQDVLETWPADLILSSDLAVLMTGEDGRRPTSRALQTIAQDAGLVNCPNQIWFGEKNVRYFIIRNRPVWELPASKRSHLNVIRDEIRRGRPGLKDHLEFGSPFKEVSVSWVMGAFDGSLDLDGGSSEPRASGDPKVVDIRSRKRPMPGHVAVQQYGVAWEAGELK